MLGKKQKNHATPLVLFPNPNSSEPAKILLPLEAINLPSVIQQKKRETERGGKPRIEKELEKNTEMMGSYLKVLLLDAQLHCRISRPKISLIPRV
jgi:hypothetical protein